MGEEMSLIKQLRLNKKSCLWVIVFVCLSVILARLVFWGEAVLPATLSEAYLCVPTDTNSFEKIENISEESAKSLYICGNLSTDGRPLTVSIHVWNSEGKLISDYEFLVEPGNISIPLHFSSQPGKYEVRLFQGREILVRLGLEVKK